MSIWMLLTKSPMIWVALHSDCGIAGCSLVFLTSDSMVLNDTARDAASCASM